MYLQIFLCLFLIQLSGGALEEPTKCLQLKSNYSKESTVMTKLTEPPVEYSCPRDFDPKSFTKCCHNGDCCEPTFLTVALNDDWLLMVTAILVISSCLFLTALSVICCFWSKCPLYNTCRANYSTSNVIVYSLGKEDPTPLMPAECNKRGQYKPCTVKIKKVQDF